MTGSADEIMALLQLRALPGLGDRVIRRLVQRFGGACEALRAPERDFVNTAGPRSRGVRATDVRERVDHTLNMIEKLDMGITAPGFPGYPGSLLQLFDPPALLFLRGRADLLERRAVAVVGARRATSYGRRTAEQLSGGLARNGVVVVSGLALGIDGTAHRAALDVGGDTIAVLGAGPDIPHPPSHRRLFDTIAVRGLLVSEFLPGEPPSRYTFPRRNRIIAALGGGVVVVEASARSGALITVEHALDLGRSVMAVPGPVGFSTEGTHTLIREGACLVRHAGDVLEELGWAAEADPDAVPLRGLEHLPAAARVLLDRLAEGPGSPDELATAVDLDLPRILALLSLLEVGGHAARSDDGSFAAVAARPPRGGAAARLCPASDRAEAAGQGRRR